MDVKLKSKLLEVQIITSKILLLKPYEDYLKMKNKNKVPIEKNTFIQIHTRKTYYK